MTNILLTTLTYVLIILMIAVIGGILRLYYLRHQQQWRIGGSSTVNDSVDKHLDDLRIENPSSMFSTCALSKRGSWRIALDQVMSSPTFEEIKAEEYSKKL